MKLNEVRFWIQIHDMPPGFMSESVGKQLGNFFGTLLEYDPNNNKSIWREYMRIRINVDVRKPLKRKKKIIRKNASEFIVQCKYERLGDFCFRCGLLYHTERFCQKKFQQQGDVEKEWGGGLEHYLEGWPEKVNGSGRKGMRIGVIGMEMKTETRILRRIRGMDQGRLVIRSVSVWMGEQKMLN